MKISTILDHIDNGHVALPEFQRGYVWNRDQVRGLFASFYHMDAVDGLLVWAAESETAMRRGDSPIAPGIVKLLLDGQQRITTFYEVIRGKSPEFFDGNAKAFTDLLFNLLTESFEFYQPVKMRDDSLWVDVTKLIAAGTRGLDDFVDSLASNATSQQQLGDYAAKLFQLLSINDIELHVEELTGADKSLDVVVDIFNRVNSGDTKLSKGDLALAKICATWPAARDEMKAKIKHWTNQGYDFSLDWLLRCVNTIVTGEAKFQHLHDFTADEFQNGLQRANKQINKYLNMISGCLGLNHDRDRVLFGRYGIPVMVRYLDQHNGALE